MFCNKKKLQCRKKPNKTLQKLIGRLYLSFNSEQIFRANKALLAEVPNILDDITETSVTGNHLLRLLTEQNTLADANTMAFVVQNASADINEKLTEKIVLDRYEGKRISAFPQFLSEHSAETISLGTWEASAFHRYS